MKSSACLRAFSTAAMIAFCCFFAISCRQSSGLLSTTSVQTQSPVDFVFIVEEELTQTVVMDLSTQGKYAGISLLAGDRVLIDRLNVPSADEHRLTALVKFDALGKVKLRIKAHDAPIIVKSLSFENAGHIALPRFADISRTAGLEKESSIKYGGPTVADFDNDGDYDFIVNNHNAANTKLYWNDSGGKLIRDEKYLSRWFMHDLHGTAAGDYDNDGDLDIVVTQGGGNGTNPSKANFYNNKDGKLVLMTGDVGINKGGRGRGARWSDMDMDGDLDLLLFNELSLKKEKPQHFFYENLGNGTFNLKSVAGIEDVDPSRVLITDFNSDNIDDIIMYGHGRSSFWQGGGDFTYLDVTTNVPADVAGLNNIMAMTDIDIDNDGDLDLYMARGKLFEGGKGEAPSLDFDPLTQRMSIKPRGFKGTDFFDFTADGMVTLSDYDFLAQGVYRGKDYPMFLGEEKTAIILKTAETALLDPGVAIGWPADLSEDGMYFGHVGGGKWKAALVRGGDIFWGFKFTLSGVSSVMPHFEPQNRNEQDVLLMNDAGVFRDVSRDWGLPLGGNALGVTTGDFNNDSHQDLMVYRWGNIEGRVSDLMLLNMGTGKFDAVTMHGASDVGGPGNGDMGQAFDFDNDGDVDLLSGSERGEWYLYSNSTPDAGNFVSIKVGYSPVSNVDAISAEVIVETSSGRYRKRVGSAGEVFSQSLLNIVHFGLGKDKQIENIQVDWRNGETTGWVDKPVNAMYDTDAVDPKTVKVDPVKGGLREGTSVQLSVDIMPPNSDPSVVWTTDNSDVLKISQSGVITATGEVGQSATVTARSSAGHASDKVSFTIIPFEPRPMTDLTINSDQSRIIVGQTLALIAEVTPENADNANVIWSSDDTSVAVVDVYGTVSAIAPGRVVITAQSERDASMVDRFSVEVAPFIEPRIAISNEALLAATEFKSGGTLTINADYHAGTGAKIIASDEGGIRFWLRHFKSKWIPVKDIVRTDVAALGTQSGMSSMTLPLQDLTPSADLPEGQFYQLRVSFATSDGEMVDKVIYPIKIVAP